MTLNSQYHEISSVRIGQIGMSHKSITFTVVSQLGANSEIYFLIVYQNCWWTLIFQKETIVLEIRNSENLVHLWTQLWLLFCSKLSQWWNGRVVQGTGHADASFYESASSIPSGLLLAQNPIFQYSSRESVRVQLLIPSILSYLILVFQNWFECQK